MLGARHSLKQVDGVELHWAEVGAGRPLVLLHGIGDSHRTWARVAPALAQTHRVLALMAETLQRAGGTLANLVTMTVFIKEPRYGDRFVELRKQKFPDGHYPGSALITVANFARPGMEIEIQGIAVIGDQDAEHPGAPQRFAHRLLSR